MAVQVKANFVSFKRGLNQSKDNFDRNVGGALRFAAQGMYADSQSPITPVLTGFLRSRWVLELSPGRYPSSTLYNDAPYAVTRQLGSDGGPAYNMTGPIAHNAGTRLREGFRGVFRVNPGRGRAGSGSFETVTIPGPGGASSTVSFPS